MFTNQFGYIIYNNGRTNFEQRILQFYFLFRRNQNKRREEKFHCRFWQPKRWSFRAVFLLFQINNRGVGKRDSTAKTTLQLRTECLFLD